MRFILFIPMLLTTWIVIGQYPDPKKTDMFKSDIEQNIFRLTTLLYYDDYEDGWPFTFSYEREIRKPFTIILKAGPSLDIREFDQDNGPWQYSINVFASGELRYYYNLRRRIRKEKTVRNFSANYLSVERTILSGPIALVNLTRSEADDESIGTFVNIGYQKQFKQGYFNVFFGPRMNIKDLKEGIVSADAFHIGIAFGIVVFE